MILRNSLRVIAIVLLICLPRLVKAQPFPNDLGIDSVASPLNVQCIGNYPFTVCINNHGTSTMTTGTLWWSLDGAPANFMFITGGPLAPGDTMLFTVGNISLGFGQHTLQFYIGSVNSNNDQNNSNDTLNVSYNIINNINVNAGPDIYFCAGDSATVACNGPYPSYSWSNGATTQSVTSPLEGIYTVTVTAVNGCTDIDTVELIEMNATFHATFPLGYFNAEFSTSFCDYNGDGYYDVYSTRTNNTLQYLMLGDSTGNFTQGYPQAAFPSSAICISWADMDNDGDEDAMIGPGAGTRIVRNDSFNYVMMGNNVFGSQEVSGSTRNVAWVDIDNNGQLDVIIGGQSNIRVKHYSTSNGGSWLNDTILNQGANSLAVGDIDNDRDQDLVVNGSSGSFQMYINDGAGNFTTPASNGLQYAPSVGSASNSWGDFDNDGDLDLLSVQSSTGTTRIFQNNMNGSWTALTNTGDLYNTNVTMTTSCWADYDGDGFLDVICGTGQQNSQDPYFMVYHSNGNGTFSLIDNDTLEMNYIGQNVGAGVGIITSDFDNDGDLDIHIAAGSNLSGTTYRNDGNCNGWLNVTLEGTVSNRSAIGTRIYAYCTINGLPQILTREVQSNTGNKSESDRRQHFGLGDATIIDSLVILWPSGITQVMYNVVPNQFLYIVEGCVNCAGTVWPGNADNDSIVSPADLFAVGLHYGDTGFARSSMSNTWAGYQCTDWSLTQSNGQNVKHADCNGNGTVDLSDTLAITLNMGNVEYFPIAPPPSTGENSTRVILPLSCEFPVTPVYAPGSWVQFDLAIGDSVSGNNALYAAALTLAIPPAYVVPGSLSVAVHTSWMTPVLTNAVDISVIDSSGNCQYGLTRIDHNNGTGYGAIATVTLQVPSSITQYTVVNIGVPYDSAVTANGNGVQIAYQPASFVIDPLLNVNEVQAENSCQIFPNPASESVQIVAVETSSSTKTVEVISSGGQSVLAPVQFECTAGINQMTLDVSSLAQGTYFVKITDDNGVVVERIAIVK